MLSDKRIKYRDFNMLFLKTQFVVSGFQNTRKGVFRTQLNPSIQTNGNASFSLSKDGPLMYHAKKFSEPWGESSDQIPIIMTERIHL